MRETFQVRRRGSSHWTFYLPAGKMTMFAQFTVKRLKEHFISDLADIHAGIIQDWNDPFVLLLHKVHDDLIVEVINLRDPEGTDSKGNRNRRGKTPMPPHVPGVLISATLMSNVWITLMRSNTKMSTHSIRGLFFLFLTWLYITTLFYVNIAQGKNYEVGNISPITNSF